MPVSPNDTFVPLPSSFFFVSIVVAVLLAEAIWKHRSLRFVFAAIVYATIVLWYLMDPFYYFADYAAYDGEDLDVAFFQIATFPIGFRVLLGLAPATPTATLKAFSTLDLDSGPLQAFLLVLWATLFTFGLSRVDWDLFTALYPTDSRSNYSSFIWHRPRIGGGASFLISIADNLYTATCAFFGFFFVAARRPGRKAMMFLMMLVSWPMFAFTGSRGILLSVLMPTVMGTLLIKPWSVPAKVIFVAVAGAAINLIMLAMVQYRDQGMSGGVSSQKSVDELLKERHLGRNMTEELLYMDQYVESGTLKVRWGGDYLDCALNVVPRALWPDKPFPGEDFADLRVGRYRHGEMRGSLVATISRGVVGQGVYNFGIPFGPLAPAVLLVVYCSWLCRLPGRGHRLLRIGVVFAALGKLPNLGRDITMFDLWPVAFALTGTLFYERYLWSRRGAAETAAPGRPRAWMPSPERSVVAINERDGAKADDARDRTRPPSK